MLTQVIDGFAERIRQAVVNQNYDELRALDAACLGFMSKNLSHEDLNDADREALQRSLNSLAEVYRSAISLCDEERNKLHNQLHAVGRGHRSAAQYLTVAGNIGR